MSPRTPCVLVALLLGLLAGCEFFTPPPEPEPDPNLDGVLRCGDLEDLTGAQGGMGVQVELPSETGVEFLTDFLAPSHGARLASETDSEIVRYLEIWDPTRQLRSIPLRHQGNETLVLELLSGNGEPLSGTVEVLCSTPAEICFNLADDSGNGRVDCADFSCARESDCVQDQEDLETVELSCSDGLVALEPPEIGTIDDQRTLYTTHPGEDGEPAQEFWGGAELAIVGVEDDGMITLRFGGAGMVCSGQDLGESIACESPVYVEDGEEATFFTTQLPLWVEPLDARWTSLEAHLDCV